MARLKVSQGAGHGTKALQKLDRLHPKHNHAEAKVTTQIEDQYIKLSFLSTRKAIGSQIQNLMNKKYKTRISKTPVKRGYLAVISEDEQQFLNYFSEGETRPNVWVGLRDILQWTTGCYLLANQSLRFMAVTEVCM